ncbi:MAG: tetratricopeptide repeat protein [Bryobacteraceae bacterium]
MSVAPRSVPLLTLKGLALQSSGDKRAALASLRQALGIQPAYPAALQAAAQIEFELRDANAGRTLESVVRLDPASEPAHSMLGVLAFEKRACPDAIAHFEKAPGAIEAPAVKWPYAVCLLEAGRYADAAKHFSALLFLREHAPTRFNLGLSYWLSKDYRQAVAALGPLDGPGASTDAMRLLASAHEQAGDVAQALAVLQKAIRSHPGDERLLIDLAVLCMDNKAVDLGVEVMQAGIAAKPRSAQLHTLLGVLEVRHGDMDAARKAFQRAEDLAPKSGLGRVGLASMMMQMGLASDAVRVLREQLAAGGSDPRVELTLARALLLKTPSPEEAREAAGLLRRIVAREPGNALAHGLLGKAYVQMGDAAKAEAELAAAIRLDPADRTSAYQLMTIYRRSGREKEAAALAQRVRVLVDQEAAEEQAKNRFQLIRENSQ